MKVTFLGTGTSLGVPQIGCKCAVCQSKDSRDKRDRPSALVELDGKKILIDAGPDFRNQLLRAKIDKLDAILITHAHADHILGLNDLTSLTYNMQGTVKIYMSPESLSIIERVFFYAFKANNGISSRPNFNIELFDDNPVNLQGLIVNPIRVSHSDMVVHGFRFNDFAYITDAKSIPEDSFKLLEGVKTLVINALRYDIDHPGHFSVLEALEAVKRISPDKAYLTHIGHKISHSIHSKLLPENVEFAYDDLVLDISDKPGTGD